jgi:outer membrane protein TolC
MFFAAGCASVHTKEERHNIKSFAAERTDAEIIWQQTEEDAKIINEGIERLLAEGLTRENAVKIALLNNHKLQSAFEEIGIAKADLVQSGLLRNPIVSTFFKIPIGGGSTGLEFEGVLSLLDLWQIPPRKKIAASRLETVILKVYEEIMNTAVEAKRFYDEYVFLSYTRDEMERIKDETDNLKDQIEYRGRFGFSGELDIKRANIAALEQEIEYINIETSLQLARMNLNRIMGFLPDRMDYDIIKEIPKDIDLPSDISTLIDKAFSNRLDLKITELKIKEASDLIGLQYRSIIRDLEAGLSYEKEPEGGEFITPSLRLSIPFFDTNQAQIAKAEFILRQAIKEFQEIKLRIRENVIANFKKLKESRQKVYIIKEQIIPAQKEAVQFAERYFNAMQLNLLHLIEARMDLFKSQKRLFEAMREQRRLELELEKAIGGILQRKSP